MTMREEIRQGTLRGTRRCQAGATAGVAPGRKRGKRRKGADAGSAEAEIFSLFAPFLPESLSDGDCLALQGRLARAVARALSAQRKYLEEKNADLD